MDDLLLNKIMGGVLGAWLLVLVLNFIVGPSLYHPHHLAEDERSYVIAVPEDGAAPAEKEPVSLASLLASADISKGERQLAKCVSCHSFEQGGAHGTGPNLWNVLQRGRATTDFGNYSASMKAMGGSWDFETLFQYLKDPGGFIDKTNMSFAGFGRKDQTAADVVAYLNTLSESPLPLPEPEAPAVDESAEGAASDAAEATDAASEEGVPAAEETAAPADTGAASESSSETTEVPTPDALDN